MKPSGVLIGLCVLCFLFAVAPTAFADQVTLTFQEGDGGAYSTTYGATVHRYFPVGNGTGPTLYASYSLTNTWDIDEELGFLAFPMIIGNNPGQIPPGATIESAFLQLTRVNYSTQTALLRVMQAPWDENTITGANYHDTKAIIAEIPSGSGVKSVIVTANVQAWVSVGGNYGFEIWAGLPGTLYSEGFFSDDAATIADRPLLSVTFTPPLTPVEPSTWGKVKALYR